MTDRNSDNIQSFLLRSLLAGIVLLMISGFSSLAADLPTIHRNLASQLGEIPVQWNGRVCPAQTMALDVAMTLYGDDSYKGLTADQILWGWITFFDDWEKDYNESHPELKSVPPFPVTKQQKQLARRLTLINFLSTARPFRIDEDLPLPSSAEFKAELLYNRLVRPLYAAATAFFLALLSLFFPVRQSPVVAVACWLLLIYASLSWGLLWFIGNHIPLTNGPEIMMFTGMAAMVATVSAKDATLRGASLVVAGMAFCVAVMGGRTPQVSLLMPALASPWLSFHVMTLMVSYALFLIIAILSLIILVRKADPHLPASSDNLSDGNDFSQGYTRRWSRLSRRLLIPAVALLAIGMTIGSVWARQAWGRYWAWDPKETCSLIMLAVYLLPLLCLIIKPGSGFCREKPLAVYLLIAAATVIFTYFGANYLLPGLHSYV